MKTKWYIYVSKLGCRWFSLWNVTCWAPSHYLNHPWIIVDLNLGNKFQWNLNLNTIIFIQEIEFENVVCKMVAIIKEYKHPASQYSFNLSLEEVW